MSFFKFGSGDVLYNRIKTHPKVEFWFYSGSVWLNNTHQSGANPNTPDGHVNLYELNVNREPTGDGHNLKSDLIYPWLSKQGNLTSFKTISTTNYNTDFVYGDVISGTYPMTASVSINMYAAYTPCTTPIEGDPTITCTGKDRLRALKDAFNYNIRNNRHYAYSSSLGIKENVQSTLISIPSIFFGSSIKKGSVNLKFYITGTEVATLNDKYRDGALYQVSGTDLEIDSGDYATEQAPDPAVAGVILYDSGFIYLSGAWPISPAKDKWHTPAVSEQAKWIHFGSSGSDPASTAGRTGSFNLSFEGVNYVPTITMFAHARKHLLNHSNNPTYIASSSHLQLIGGVNPMFGGDLSSSTTYWQATGSIKNTVSSTFSHNSASFQKQTFISKIGIYDENKNLIAIAKMAQPTKKTDDRDFTFKLKLDI